MLGVKAMIPTDLGNIPFEEIAAKVKNIEEAKAIQYAAASLAISNMPVSKELIMELVKVANGEKPLIN